MSEPQFSLSDYLSTVQEVIQITFNEPVWVKAEIRNLNIKGGHYYLELAEKDENTDKVIASCKGTIWKFTAQKMVLKFERESGVELSKDLNVLVKVRAKFDPQYGFSVNVEDIDSSYTLGDIARRYQQILERLTGTKGVCKPNSGNFKKGQISWNKKPVGYERICCKDGYVLVKTAEPNVFELKHRVIWEKENGPVPMNQVLAFKNQDKTDCRLENLILMSRTDMVRYNQSYQKLANPENNESCLLMAKVKNMKH